MSRVKSRNHLRRRIAKRAPCDRVLAVCEGSRTEWHYFRDLVDHYRLSAVDVQIIGLGADPDKIVREADKIARGEKRIGEKFDNVFCVFDRDEHESFDQAWQQISK